MALELQSTSQALGSVRQILRLGAESIGTDSRFELLRATVWGLSSQSTPVHVARVLNAALPPWRLLCGRQEADEDGLRSELREALASLLDAGDLIEASGGHWAAATTRLVRLERDARHLLVGGAPLSVLPINQEEIEYRGPYRHVGRSEALSAMLPKEELSSWAKLPKSPLCDWAQDLRESLERLPYAPTSHEGFEFYLPGSACPLAPQFKRWAEAPGVGKSTLLARRTRLYGAKEYRLVDVEAGHIVRACELPTSEARRLMYALDSEAGNPVKAHCSVGGRNLTEVVLTSELPRPEQRVFAALGTLEIPVDRPFERRWSFRQSKDLALNLLRSLGIEVAATPREVSQ